MSRVAFVTGAGGGIGGAVSRELARLGHRVVVADVREDAAKAVAAEIGGFGVAVDVTDLGSVKDAVAAGVAHYGPIEIGINCAGWHSQQSLLDMDDSHIYRQLEVNLLGVIRVTREVVGPMAAAGWGRIVNVSSEAGRTGGGAGYSAYAAAKAGVNAFTKAIAVEFAGSAVTANAMSPGAIDTALLRSPFGDDYPALRERLENVIPMRRVGTPEEAAAAVCFFASEAAGFISGQILAVNGAQSR